MNDQQIERFKQLLLKEKGEILKSIKIIEETLKTSEQESTGELSQYDNHSGDSATTVFEREKDLGLKDNEIVILNQINEALAKIESGSYGYCSLCGQEIDLKRLEVLSYATLCINCQEKTEDRDDRSLRPLEEESLKNPFKDDEDITGFNREDSWQAVARYEQLPEQSEYLGFDNEVEDDLGYVEEVEKISNQQYKQQLE